VRRALPLLFAVLAASVAACGDDKPESTRVRGDTFTVYASVPAHGTEARAGRAAELGMRRALAEAGGVADGRKVKLVSLPSTRPGDDTWDPGTVESNADRAAEDPTTIAYIGELDRGASAVSLPVTNREQILQVSPADTLTSLTRRPPGRPRAGPERYYPSELQTFVRLVPPDLGAARRVVADLRARGTRRLAIVTGDGIADHEFEAMLLGLIGTGQPQTVDRFAAPDRDDDPDGVSDLADDLVESDPQAIVYVAADSRPTRAVLAAIGARLPSVTLIAGPTATRQQELLARSARCARLLGHEAMRLTLAAVDAAGPDRRAVVKAAKAAPKPVSPCR
jgi:ABC-type branched-subunit amino acid transport system substrate-binding protein